MPREETPITVDERGNEHHPSFGVVTLHRYQSTGTNLFQSDLTHHDLVGIKIHGAKRERSLGQDWVYTKDAVIEIEMSLAQFASFVSSSGQGSGTPCTITWDHGPVPAAPHESRMAKSTGEVKGAAEKALGTVQKAARRVREAFDAKAGRREMGPLIDDLERVVQQAPGNMVFATKQLDRHVENTVQQAKADIEAMVVRAQEGQIEAGSVTLELPEGEEV